MPLEPARLAAEEGATRPATVVVVDDEDDIRDSLRWVFESTFVGVRVRTASSGTEALDLVDRERADIVVADYRMPGMNGVEFLARVRRRFPDTTRILITAFPESALASQMVHASGVDLLLTKPLDPGRLIDMVGELLERRRSRPGRNPAA